MTLIKTYAYTTHSTSPVGAGGIKGGESHKGETVSQKQAAGSLDSEGNSEEETVQTFRRQSYREISVSRLCFFRRASRT